MQQPPGFEDAQHPSYVYRLHKAIYGLKQSPHAWYSRLTQRLQELGFVPSRADVSLFVLSRPDLHVYILVYVDDIIIASSCPMATTRLLAQLSASFPVKDLGPLNYFLGIEVSRNSRGGGEVTLNRAHMENCKHVSTPMSVQDKLSVQIGTTLSADDAFAYRSTVCGLQYLTLTRPDLSFAMNKVCQFLGKLSSGFFGM